MSDYEVPDGIEAMEGWRFWKFDDHGLKSLTRPDVWKPLEKMSALCSVHGDAMYAGYQHFRWSVVKGGMTREQAEAHRTMSMNYATAANSMMMFSSSSSRYTAQTFSMEPVPATVLPPQYGFVVEGIGGPGSHEAPEKNCTCGIYAAKELADCPDGKVFGKVKMWGKIVPGEKGWRAQYAYPSELYAPESLVNHPALLAYGVPVTSTGFTEPVEVTVALAYERPRWATRLFWTAFALNVAGATTNLLVAGLHL